MYKWWSVGGSNFNSDGSNGNVCINRPLPSNRLRSSSSPTLPYCVYFSYLSYFIPVPSFPSLKSLVLIYIYIYIYMFLNLCLLSVKAGPYVRFYTSLLILPALPVRQI